MRKDGDDYNLRQSIIKNCEPYYPDLFSDNDLVSKALVDAEIAKLPKPDLDVLKLDGSRAMTGNLKMGNQEIRGLKEHPNNPSSDNPPRDAAINAGYFLDQRANLNKLINEVASDSLNRKTPQRMEAKLDMHLFDIINLPTADSNESSYAANVNYVNKTVIIMLLLMALY